MGQVKFVGDVQLREIILPGGKSASTEDGRSEWTQQGVLDFQDVDGQHITVGTGATTDLGSVPQLAWSLGFPPDGVGVRAYLVHDLLYRTKGTCAWTGFTWRTRKQPYTRAEADAILRRGLIACGVPEWRAWAIWSAVRAGGWTGWGK